MSRELTPTVGVARRLSTAWLAACVILGAVAAFSSGVSGGFDGVTRMYFVEHDLPVVGLGWAILLGAAALGGRLAAHDLRLPVSPRVLTVLASVGTALVAYAGVTLVFERHALSADELMVVFDAAVFRSGRLAAAVAPEWRAFAPAMQPSFLLPAPGNAWWISAYLPVNAMLRTGFDRLGDGALAGPVWAGVSVLLVYAIGRRLRPERPAFALTAAVLLATSSQLLITAMTPYAMSAHLALNLLWLWLFLRGGVPGHGGAMAVALAVTGLHQLVFHPLFAGPFVLGLWLTRRWGPAAAHTLAYVVIGLFWSSYFGWALPTPPADTGGTLGGLAERAVAMATSFELGDVADMAVNLLRFTVWQNPLTVPLLAVSLLATWRLDATTSALWAGLILTVLAMAALLPYQGQGWGYRYLHGLLGSASLLGALGWLRLVDGLSEPARRREWVAFGVVSLGALLVLLPLRAWQTHRYVHPYAAASRFIARVDADIVLVDEEDLWFGSDLVRNDPFLRNRPKVLRLQSLNSEGVAQLCGRGRVFLFDRTTAERFGMRTAEEPTTARTTELRRQMLSRSCGLVAWRASTNP